MKDEDKTKDQLIDELRGLREQVEETLRESEEKYRAYVENAPDGIFVTDADGRYIDVNEAACRMTGYSRGELLSMSSYDLASPQAPPGTLGTFAALKRTGETQGEILIRRKDGADIRVSLNAVAFAGDRHIAFCMDITERKRAEDELQKLAAAVKHSGELVNLATLEGKMVFLNEAGSKMLGIDPQEVGNVNIMQVIPEHLVELVERDLLPTLMRGETWEGDLQYINLKTGSLTDVHAMTFTVTDPDTQGPLFLANVSMDITERKRSEEEKARLEERLHHSQKMEAIGRLAGGVAHDFNNVLCTITGNADLVLDDLSAGDRQREPIEEIAKAAARAADLTRQLLAFSRRQVIEPKVIDLSRLIESLHSMLVRLIGEDIILRCVPQEDIGRVRVDPGQVEQVVLNLAINARDAMPDGGELLIETADVVLDDGYCEEHANATPGPCVMLAVSDTGCGMSTETCEQIFEPFFTTKQLGQGTGLGLATVIGIVEQHGGRIEVHSELGMGSSFKVYFPRVADEARTLARSVPPASPTQPAGQETVLVVEDEEAVRSLAAQLLARLGYRVLTASSGGDAIALVQRDEATIDLLFTDVVMPHMNGRQLAERITKLRPGIKVLYTSGYTQDVIAHHGVLDEGVRFIPKPYSLRTLSARIREVLDQA